MRDHGLRSEVNASILFSDLPGTRAPDLDGVVFRGSAGPEVPHVNMPAKCGRCLIYFCPRNLGYPAVSLLVVLLVVFRCERWVVSRVLRLPSFELFQRRAG